MSDESPLTESFDAFLEASAEAAIKHVVNGAKDILRSLDLWIVSQRELEYNDEYHYFTGGGTPQKFFLDEESAIAFIKKETVTQLRTTGSYDMWGGNRVREIDGDEDNPMLDDCAEALSKDGWEVTFKEFIEWMEKEGHDPYQHLPEMYSLTKITAGG